MLGVVAAFAVAPDSLPESLPGEAVKEQLTPTFAAIDSTAYGEFLREERVQKNDTIASLIYRLGISDAGLAEFIRSNPEAAATARQLRPGQLVSAYTEGDGQFKRLYFPLSARDVLLAIEKTGKVFSAREEVAAMDRHVVIRAGEIRSSLFGATDAAGIPDPVATQLAEVFGGVIDFHRDLRKGDRFAVTYEMLRVRGQLVRSGRILAAEFINAGKQFQAIWHAGADGTGSYYDADGKSLRKAFLRSPIEFSRVTSGFTSNRFHPVLNQWRAHRGVDYGAPIGTRIRATGDGTVEFAGRQGGYGNLVVIRHRGSYSTAYGHLNGFTKGLHRGSRVSQGDVIGFVGQTGLASGPHLHYEFRINDQQVNPLAVVLPESPPLDQQSLAAFRPIATAAISRLALGRSVGGPMIE
jgi:murein DD-endopeptidase MepM/ murein hydrolase activator NlpD